LEGYYTYLIKRKGLAQAIASYKPKLLWRDAADETGREDQTKKGM
jgi:hypothetical protein